MSASAIRAFQGDYGNMSDEKDHRKQIQQANHDFIVNFLLQTSNDFEPVTVSIKATICQFLNNTRHGLNLRAEKHGGTLLTWGDCIEEQIEQLRRCVIDLQRCLNNKEVMQ